MGMKGGKKGNQGWKGRGGQKGKPRTPAPDVRPSQAASQWDWPEEDAPAASTGPRRMVARNVFAKGLLRPYADENLRFLYTDDPDTFFEKSNLRAYLSTENSELDRRPAFGWSMLCGSIRSLSQAVDATEQVKSSMQELQALLSKEKKLMEALSKCSWDNAKKSKKDLKKHAIVVLNFLKSHSKQLHSILPEIMNYSAALYGGAGQMLDGVVHAGALGRWQSLVPSWPEGAKALRRWKKEKPTPESTGGFLQDAYLARAQVESSWNQAQTWRGDDSSSTEKAEGKAENPWGRYGEESPDSTASSSMDKIKAKKRAFKKKHRKGASSSTEAKKPKKKQEKASKKKKHVSSSSSVEKEKSKTKSEKKKMKATESSDADLTDKKEKKAASFGSSDEERKSRKKRKSIDVEIDKSEEQKMDVGGDPRPAAEATVESDTK